MRLLNIRALVPDSVQRLPGDLAAVVATVILTGIAVYAPLVSTTPVRVVFGFLFVLFMPGYAVLAALFPMGGQQDSNRNRDSTTGPLPSRGITPVERWTLSIAVSIAMTILLGLLIELSPWRIGLGSVFSTIAVATLGTTTLAAWRRQQLPRERQLTVPIGPWYRTVRDRIAHPPTRVDGLLNVALVLVVVFAAWGIAYGSTDPTGGALTTVGLLAEQPDGEFDVGNYRTNVSAGESRNLALVVTNQEYESINYTVVVHLQRLEDSNETSVSNVNRLDRTTVILAHNQSRRVTQNVTFREPGTYRLNFLVYRGTVPSTPSIENAYREVHLILTVAASAT